MNIRIPKFTKSFYFIFALCFLIWMLFFDANDFISQYRLKSKLNNLKDQKQYYIKKIEEVKKDREELLNNPELLEKFAREKYLMKKKGEDVFVIVRE